MDRQLPPMEIFVMLIHRAYRYELDPMDYGPIFSVFRVLQGLPLDRVLKRI